MSEFDINDSSITDDSFPDTIYAPTESEDSGSDVNEASPSEAISEEEYEKDFAEESAVEEIVSERASEDNFAAAEASEDTLPPEAGYESQAQQYGAPSPGFAPPPPQYTAPQYTAPQYGQPQYQPYQGGYPKYQPHPQTSRGYYQPETNEYVYSPQPPKKKGNGGKAFLITIVCLLSVFVIAVGAVSVYNFIGLYTGSLRPNYFYDPNEKHDKPQIDDHRNDEDPSDGPVDGVGNDNDAKPTVSTPVAIRDYPNIEQLAAPEDAMKIPDIYDKVSPSVVGVSCEVRGGTQTGTGFVISEDGYIVTNAHVIENYISVMIVDSDLNEYEAEVVGSDSQTDIAVLKVDPEGQDLVAVEFGISTDLRIGELAIAIGNPLGFELYGTMTTGIISGLNRTVTIGDNTMNLLQTSATINRGNSGGPLIDAYGRVIGITSAKVDTTYGESLGFAIPIDEAIPIIENLIKYGYVPGRPSLGIFSSQDITSLFSLYYRLPEGVYVLAVTPDSGAAKAGILPGDVIIGIQGESITSMDELNAIKNQYAVGDTVTLTIYRNRQNFDVEVVLSESTPENSVYPGE